MRSFSAELTLDDAEAIHQFIISRARIAHENEQSQQTRG
jgi:hypothetical protein